MWPRPSGIRDRFIRTLRTQTNLQGEHRRWSRKKWLSTMFGGLKAKRRINIAQEVRDIIKVNNHEAVQIDELRKHKVVNKVVSPRFGRYHYHGACVGEGVDRQTLWERRSCHSEDILEHGGHRQPMVAAFWRMKTSKQYVQPVMWKPMVPRWAHVYWRITSRSKRRRQVPRSTKLPQDC